MARDAYIAVIRLVESVDDTITCQKTILAELLKPLEVRNRRNHRAVPYVIHDMTICVEPGCPFSCVGGSSAFLLSCRRSDSGASWDTS